MKDQLTRDQIEYYRENGFLVIEGFLDAEELAEWRRCTDEAVEQRLSKDDIFLQNQGDPDAYYARVFTQCLKLAETHPGMHALMHDPRLGRVAATLAGVDGIRIWHDQALIKPPFGNPTAFHLDVPYWSFSSRQAISIWVALDDATLANGCMWYLPGTHKTARYENVEIGQNLGGLLKVYPEWRSIEPVAGPCPAGSAVFHNGLTAHGAGANMTTRPRRAMTCAYMPDGSTFNGTRNILPEVYFQSLSLGDLLNDDKINPLIWHKDREAA
jgi:ectoine hydroxylase-related dioxygenase (phytanoyl-CoA dioxygenase family)